MESEYRALEDEEERALRQLVDTVEQTAANLGVSVRHLLSRYADAEVRMLYRYAKLVLGRRSQMPL